MSPRSPIVPNLPRWTGLAGFARLVRIAGGLRSFAAEREAQALPRPRQARHHGANRHAGGAGDFFVRQSFHLAHHDRLAVLDRQRLERAYQRLAIDAAKRRRLGIGSRAGGALMLFFVEDHAARCRAAGELRVTYVAHDREQPGAAIAAAKPTRETHRT